MKIQNICSLLLVSIALLFSGNSVSQTSERKPRITIATGNEIAPHLTYWELQNIQYYINFYIEGELSVDFIQRNGRHIDVYFGAVTPDQKIVSFVAAARDPSAAVTLSEGLKPFTTNYELAGDQIISTYTMQAPYVSVLFDNSIPRGVYTLFTLILPAGKPVEDLTNWEAIGTLNLSVLVNPPN
jgi:hypothetical protein